MPYLFLSVSLIAFVVCIRSLGIVETAAETIRLARKSATITTDTALDDAQKETMIRSAGIRMFRAFLTLSLQFAASIAIAVAVSYAGVLGGLYTIDTALSAASNWVFIAASTVVTVFALFYSR